MRPAGVMSKNDIGERKIAVAILSCSLREALTSQLASKKKKSVVPGSLTSMEQKNPQDQGLA